MAYETIFTARLSFMNRGRSCSLLFMCIWRHGNLNHPYLCSIRKEPPPKVVLSENAANQLDDLIALKLTSRLQAIESATSTIISSTQDSSDTQLTLNELRARLEVAEQSRTVMKMKKALLAEQLAALKQNRKLEAENAQLQQRISELEVRLSFFDPSYLFTYVHAGMAFSDNPLQKFYSFPLKQQVSYARLNGRWTLCHLYRLHQNLSCPLTS